VFSVGSSTGAFEIHIDDIGKLGLDLGFWIAVALAYSEFVGDREVSWTVNSLGAFAVLNHFSGILGGGG
jgi:hypothetical protein